MPEDPQFFESLYRSAGRDAAGIPWASLTPSPLVVNWLAGSPSAPGTAVVVACGLGDDAEALAVAGWTVAAFDIAPSAIDWCIDRFPDTNVAYQVQDLFELPGEWLGAFELVVEVFTVQSFPPGEQRNAMHQIASLVAPGGTLLVTSVGRPGPPTKVGPPWPPARSELAAFAEQGLVEVDINAKQSPWEGFELLEVEYRRGSEVSKP